MLHRNTNYIIFSFLLDWAVVFVAAGLATWLRGALPFGPAMTETADYYIHPWQGFFIYPAVFLLFSLYDPERTYRAVDEYQILSIASFLAALALAGLAFMIARELSRLTLLYFFGIHFVMVAAWRAVVRLIRRSSYSNGQNQRRVLLVGGGEAARRALDRLDELAWAGVQLVGYLTDGEPIPNASKDIPLLGTLGEMERVVQQMMVADVLLALPAEAYSKVNELVTRLVDQPCSVWVVPDYFSLLLYGGHVDDLGGVPLISLKYPTLTGYQRVMKRVFDLVVVGLIIIMILPVIGLIAIAIRLDSPGPAFFKQQRVGENGKLFGMFKFRSMVQDADSRLKDVIKYDADGNLIHKSKDDPRVTRVGRFIRRWSLDEFPQFFNVLRGDMSLVGPRPEMPFLVEKYEPWQRVRFAVPQGITGWWQVNGRSDKPMHLNTEDDLYYVRHYSMLLDLYIIMKTPWVALRGRGAF